MTQKRGFVRMAQMRVSAPSPTPSAEPAVAPVATPEPDPTPDTQAPEIVDPGASSEAASGGWEGLPRGWDRYMARMDRLCAAIANGGPLTPQLEAIQRGMRAAALDTWIVREPADPVAAAVQDSVQALRQAPRQEPDRGVDPSYTASYTRLRSGEWGVRIRYQQGAVRSGDRYVVRKRSGAMNPVTIDRVVWTGPGRNGAYMEAVCSIAR